jgi:hypothetical protein
VKYQFKAVPDHFYHGWFTVYYKGGWWPFWRKGGWYPNSVSPAGAIDRVAGILAARAVKE